MIKETGKEVFIMSDLTDRVRLNLGNGRGTLWLAIIGILISVSASFMFCLASIGFDFSQLAELVFWSRWASMAVTSLVGYFLVILHKDEKNRMIEWYATNMRKIADRAADIGEKFDEFLKIYNERRRIEMYKRQINEKIAALNQRALALEIRGKSSGSIQSKIERYKERITDVFIASNKNALKTRSKPISAIQVLSEARRGDGVEINFRSAGSYYFGKGAAKIVLSLVMTAAFACVVVQNFNVGISIASVVMTILSVLSTLISVFSAIMAANGCYRNVYVPNLLYRLKILADYDAWREKNPPEPKSQSES